MFVNYYKGSNACTGAQAGPSAGGGGVTSMQEQLAKCNQKADLDDWQKHFSKQFSNLFQRVERIRNYKLQAELFKKLTPNKKGRRLPIF